jgi:hypothetical protein
MGIRAQLLLAVSERRWNREAGTEFHVDHELTVDAHVEGKPIRIMNREVGHDFRKAPNRTTRFQSEGLIDQHVVNKHRLQRAWSGHLGPGRADHHAGAEFVVLAEIAVYEVREDQRDGRTAR